MPSQTLAPHGPRARRSKVTSAAGAVGCIRGGDTGATSGFVGTGFAENVAITVLEMGERKIIARRAALELRPGVRVNLGIGLPEGVSAVAVEEGASGRMTPSTGPGGFGASAITGPPSRFDVPDGSGLDICFLGLAQADRHGNLDVGRPGLRPAGGGGFINLSQSTKAVIFVGTFTTGGLEIAVEEGSIRIVKEGARRTFVKEVGHRAFSGSQAFGNGRKVLYVTERCVFRLAEKGLELIEIAPGVDLDRDILGRMDFTPILARDLKLMDYRIFREEPMGLLDLLPRE
ncbi:MAG: hypothetical protein HGA66_05665 [Holophaga sp.]|nr:hypothetical protein [Holophaga sp.]